MTTIILFSETPDKFETVETRAQELFKNSKLSGELTKEITNQLERIFEDRLEHVKFAVRSSAVSRSFSIDRGLLRLYHFCWCKNDMIMFS